MGWRAVYGEPVFGRPTFSAFSWPPGKCVPWRGVGRRAAVGVGVGPGRSVPEHLLGYFSPRHEEGGGWAYFAVSVCACTWGVHMGVCGLANVLMSSGGRVYVSGSGGGRVSFLVSACMYV